MKLDSISFELENQNVKDFIENVNKEIESIKSKHPEVDVDKIKFAIEDAVDYEYEKNHVVLWFRRNKTERELEIESWEREDRKKREIAAMKQFMQSHTNDAVEFLKELGYNI